MLTIQKFGFSPIDQVLDTFDNVARQGYGWECFSPSADIRETKDGYAIVRRTAMASSGLSGSAFETMWRGCLDKGVAAAGSPSAAPSNGPDVRPAGLRRPPCRAGTAQADARDTPVR